MPLTIMMVSRNILMSNIEFSSLRSDLMSSYHQAVRDLEWLKAREYRDCFNELLAQYWALKLTR